MVVGDEEEEVDWGSRVHDSRWLVIILCGFEGGDGSL